MQQHRLLELVRLPSWPNQGRPKTAKCGAVCRPGVYTCMLACLILSACADTTEVGPYPRLQPLDSLLAQADSFSADPGPAQVQRAGQLQNRMLMLAQ